MKKVKFSAVYIIIFLSFCVIASAKAATYSTPNFIVSTADPALAEKFGKAMEQDRKDLVLKLLGGWDENLQNEKKCNYMPDWGQPAPITILVGSRVGCGGETTFLFDRGEAYGWRMSIQGNEECLLSDVIPHEITHMILASFFRRAVPRWVDEGTASSVESETMIKKHQRMLTQFLQTGRGIAFNDLVSMSKYPRDVMPLYAEGTGLVNYVTQRNCVYGYKNFLRLFLRQAMENSSPKQGENAKTALIRSTINALTSTYYDDKNVPLWGDMGVWQYAWTAWVGSGYPRLVAPNPGWPRNKQLIPVSAQCAVEPNKVAEDPIKGLVRVVKFCTKNDKAKCDELDIQFKTAKPVFADNLKVQFVEIDVELDPPTYIAKALDDKYFNIDLKYPEIDYAIVYHDRIEFSEKIPGFQSRSEIIESVRKAISKAK